MARERAKVLTQRGSAFLSSGLVLVLAGVLLGQPDLTRIGVLVLVLLTTCYVLGRLRPAQMTVERVVVPARLAVDDSARVLVSLHNEGEHRTPITLAEEKVQPSLGDRPRFTVPATGVGQFSEVEYSIRPHVRGLHPLGPLRIWTRDPFGLTSAGRTTAGSGAVLVVPRIHPLSTGRALGRGVGTEGTIPHQVALHGEDDQAIREYREGDDLRRIHWPATARTGDLMVRQEDRPARRRAVILLDDRAGGHRGQGPHSSFEWFVTMAASVGAHALDLGYAVHLLTPDPTVDAGTRNDEDLETMLDTLARIQPGADDGFRSVLHAAHAVTGTGGLLVALVTGMDDDATRALAALRQPGSTAIALVHVPSDDRSPQATLAGGTLASLVAAGWLAAPVTGSESPARVWGDLTGATLPELIR